MSETEKTKILETIVLPIYKTLSSTKNPEIKTANLELKGLWLWLTFDKKPSNDTRTELKSFKFRYNQKRTLESNKSVWQFAGCKKTGRKFVPRSDVNKIFGNTSLKMDEK